MSNKSLVLWSIGLTLPVQYVFWLIGFLIEFFSADSRFVLGDGGFGCSNFHETGLVPCSLGEMLANPIVGVMVMNVLSSGLVSVFFAVLIGAVFWSVRAIRRGALKRT